MTVAQSEPTTPVVKNIAKEAFGASILIEFVASFESFGLLLELLLTPIILISILIAAFTDKKSKFASANKLANGVIIVLGLAIIANGAVGIISSRSSFLSVDTLLRASLPLQMTVMFLPFLYLMRLDVVYETAFLRIKYNVRTEGLARLARLLVLMNFRTDLKGLQEWLRQTSIERVSTKAELFRSIRKANKWRRWERRSRVLAPLHGWAPRHAISFLADHGLLAGDYRETCGEWHASSTYHEIGKGLFPNNIAFYLSGDELSVRELKLVLNVNDKEDEEEALTKFQALVAMLVQKAVYGKPNLENTYDVVLDGPATRIRDVEVSLAKEAHLPAEKGTYTLTATLRASDQNSLLDPKP